MIDRDKVIKGLYAHGYRDCKSCPYWGTGNNGMSACRQLARDAYSLLKEQEPIKPNKIGAGWFCGGCNKFLTSNDDKWIKFCLSCGKPVLWEGR